MPKPTSLTLAEKYELLKKKQAEKQISKQTKTDNNTSSSSIKSNDKLLELLAKKQNESKKKKEYKLPGNLQRALKEDPKILEKKKAQHEAEEEAKKNELEQQQRELDEQSSHSTRQRRSFNFGEEDNEYFIKRTPSRNGEREYSSNRTFTDDQGKVIHYVITHKHH